MNFKEHSSFQKEFKRFKKKYPSLTQDLALAKQTISTIYQESAEKIRQDFFAGVNATILHKPTANCEIVKMRLACRTLKTQRILRLVFCHLDDQVILLEIFAKNNKAREDQRRIKPYIKL